MLPDTTIKQSITPTIVQPAYRIVRIAVTTRHVSSVLEDIISIIIILVLDVEMLVRVVWYAMGLIIVRLGLVIRRVKVIQEELYLPL